jgi:succinoglycan biosynthesis protein ExoM
MHKVAICVCTFRRPIMLRACLDSLARQRVDPDLDVSIVVVDNEEHPAACARVGGFAEDCPFPVHYIHEPRRGIAAARNAALNEAMRIGANWIAMLDDDETADPDWLNELMAPEYLHVPVLMGTNIAVYPKPLPFWVKEEEPKGEEGQKLKTAATGNVRFSTDLIRAGLRFDERIGLGGGEDNDLFSRAHATGFAIRRTLRAVTRETAHPERLTYLALAHRSYWCAGSELRRLMITRGWMGALLRKGHTIPLNIIVGILWLLGAVMVAPVSSEAFRDGALEGGRKLAKAAGRFAALVGHMPQPYRNVVGA